MAENIIPLRTSDFSGPAPNVEKCQCWLCANEKAALTTQVERLRAALELYRDAVRIDATMEGPKFMGANSSALKRAWDADRAALEGRT